MFHLVEFPPATWLQAAQALFALCIGHALCDFPLQGEFIALCKNRRHLVLLKDPERPPSLWLSCMAAHCLIHAGMVWLITGSALLGLVELIAHWVLDTLKCEGKTNFNLDQSLHVACKTLYVIAAWAHWVG